MYADIAAQSRSLLVSAAHCQCRDLRPLLLSFANKEYVPIYSCVVITKYDNITLNHNSIDYLTLNPKSNPELNLILTLY